MITLDPKSVLKALKELKPLYRTKPLYRPKHILDCLDYLLVVADCDGFYLAYLDEEVYYSRVEITALGEGCYPVLPHLLRDICRASDGLITLEDYRKGNSRWLSHTFNIVADGCTWTINTIDIEDMPPLHRISIPEVSYIGG